LLYILIILCILYRASTLCDTNFSIAWENFTQDSQLSHATYSLTILDHSTGNIIFAFNKDVGLAPASTLKTVTGSAALHYLGIDYRYKTLLQYSGTIDPDGKLDGYVYIVGEYGYHHFIGQTYLDMNRKW
jgi:serine-type D-Ala-D-Ala carboxypeptidase/endopeptidase (penicillin-binding protein 4)